MEELPEPPVAVLVDPVELLLDELSVPDDPADEPVADPPSVVAAVPADSPAAVGAGTADLAGPEPRLSVL